MKVAQVVKEYPTFPRSRRLISTVKRDVRLFVIILTNLLTYLFIYLLFTSCSSVLLEKLTGPQLVKKFPILYGTRKFITAFTSAELMFVIRGNKRPTGCNRMVSLLQILVLVQHVSGTIMHIIRSSRVVQMVAACGTWRFGLQVVGLVWSCRLYVRVATSRKPNA